MSDQSIKDKVISTLALQFVIDKTDVKPEHHLFHDLGMDSLDSVELLMMMEDELHITIPDDEAERLTTVQQVIDYMIVKVQSCPQP